MSPNVVPASPLVDVARGIDWTQPVTTALSDAADAQTRALIDGFVHESGPPPARFAWVVFGSHARRELHCASDQDSALFWQTEQAARTSYAKDLAVAVIDGLERFGLRPCDGGYMADTWSYSLEQWQQILRERVDAPTPDAVVEGVVAGRRAAVARPDAGRQGSPRRARGDGRGAHARARVLHRRQGRAAGPAKALFMPRARQTEAPDVVRPREPVEPRRGREQVGRMGRAGVLAAAAAMAQEKPLERPRDPKCHRPAQAASRRRIVHADPRLRAGTARARGPSLSGQHRAVNSSLSPPTLPHPALPCHDRGKPTPRAGPCLS